MTVTGASTNSKRLNAERLLHKAIARERSAGHGVYPLRGSVRDSMSVHRPDRLMSVWK